MKESKHQEAIAVLVEELNRLGGKMFAKEFGLQHLKVFAAQGDKDSQYALNMCDFVGGIMSGEKDLTGTTFRAIHDAIVVLTEDK